MLTEEELLGATVERLRVRPAISPRQRVGMIQKGLCGSCGLGIATPCQMAEMDGRCGDGCEEQKTCKNLEDPGMMYQNRLAK